MNLRTARHEVMALAATAAIAGGIAQEAQASPQPLPGNGPNVCQGYTNGVDPTVSIHEAGSTTSPQPAHPGAGAPDPLTGEPFNPRPATPAGEYTNTDTPLNDPNNNDRYSTFAQCNGPVVSENNCSTLGGKIQLIAVDSFKDDGNSYMAYQCIGTERGGYPPESLGDDAIYTQTPQSDCPDGSYALSAPQPASDMKSAGDNTEHTSTVVGGSYYCDPGQSYINPELPDYPQLSNVSPRFIQKCVQQSLAKGQWSVSRLVGRPFELLVEHEDSRPKEQLKGLNGVTCDDFVSEKQTKVVPMLGNNTGSSKLRNNSFGVNTFNEQGDFDAVVETGRRYTCAGTAADNKVRRFGAKVIMSVLVDQHGKRPKVEVRTFTVTAPKRVLVNNKLVANGC